MPHTDKHGPRVDDALDSAAKPMPPGGSSRAEEWRDPEAPGADETMTERPGGTPPGMTTDDVDERAELARHLRSSDFPADAARLRATADDNGLSGPVRDELDRLPDGRYENVNAVWTALGHGVEDDSRRT